MKCQAEGLGTFPKLQHLFQVTWSRKNYRHFPSFHANDAILYDFSSPANCDSGKLVASWPLRSGQCWKLEKVYNMYQHDDQDATINYPLVKSCNARQVVDVAEGERGPFRNPGDVLSACQEFNSRKAGDFFMSSRCADILLLFFGS